MLVNKIMTLSPASCTAEQNLNEAAGYMWNNNCGVVPILDADNKVVGILTDRDICIAAYTQGRLLRDIRIRDVMAKSVFTCMEDDTVSQAEALMARYQVRRLPVVNGQGQLVGMLSLNDIANAAASAPLGPRHGVSMEAVGRTLAAVCARSCPVTAH